MPGAVGVDNFKYRPHSDSAFSQTEVGVLVRKLSQLTLLSSANRANPRYFILLCGISGELDGCVHRPIMDSESTIAG
jgi:hypothetical protein